jgi:hypothetical protein
MTQVSEFKRFAEAVDALADTVLKMHSETPFTDASHFVIVAPDRTFNALASVLALRLENVPGHVHFHSCVAMFGPQTKNPAAVFLVDNKDPDFHDEFYPMMTHKFYCEEPLVPSMHSVQTERRSMRGHTCLYLPYDEAGYSVGSMKITLPKKVAVLEWRGNNLPEMMLHTHNIFLASNSDFKDKVAAEGLTLPTASGVSERVDVGDYVVRDSGNNLYVMKAYLVEAFLKDIGD